MIKGIIVVDLNVFVRALLTKSADRAIYEAIKESKIIPAFCSDMLENLLKVLIRPRLRLNLSDIKELLEIIRLKAIIVKPEIKITACRDASDNIILETAVACNAKMIISNDDDLLVLNPFRGIPIIDSHRFLKALEL